MFLWEEAINLLRVRAIAPALTLSTGIQYVKNLQFECIERAGYLRDSERWISFTRMVMFVK